MDKEKGLLVVLASPSGGGKTTVIKNILKSDNDDFIYSVSLTTRPARDGEVNGRDYWFVSLDEFMNKVNNHEILEYERVHDWYYGTPEQPIRQWLKDDKIVLLDLDVFGALNIKKHFANSSLLIFLQPPNEEALIQRLKARSTETAAQIAKRLQRLPEEMSKAELFDVVIVNDDLKKTVQEIKKMIYKAKTFQQMEV